MGNDTATAAGGGLEGFAVFVTRALPAPGIGPLQASGCSVTYHDDDEPLARDDLLTAVRGAHGVLCMLSDRIDVELMDAAGPQLSVVANLAVGYDNVDIAAATERGIVVTNTPDVLTDATADLAWALILAAARRVVEGDALVRNGEWGGWCPTQLLGAPVYGRTLGILGMGKIGAAVAKRGIGFGMSIVYHNRSRDLEAEAALGARYVELDELLAVSDVLSLHAPLNEQSRHIIDAAALKRMKPTAMIINTGRGPLIDEAALVAALSDGTIAAAGLDVFEREPALEDGLTGLDNVVLLPHIGSATTDARGTMVELCSTNITAVLRGDTPPTPLNPEAL